jgi:hypothetical protein
VSAEQKPPLADCMVGGLVASIASIVLNNAYFAIYPSVTGFSRPEIIHVMGIVGASTVPTLIGALLYWGMSRVTGKASIISRIVGGLFAVVSCANAFGDQLPDGTAMPVGFAGLTVPMHLLTGLLAIVITPWWANRKG